MLPVLSSPAGFCSHTFNFEMMTTHYSVITESVCLEHSWKQDHLKSSVPNEHLWQTAAGRSRTVLSEVTRQETWNEATVTAGVKLQHQAVSTRSWTKCSQSSGCNKEKSLKIKSGLEYFMHHPAAAPCGNDRVQQNLHIHSRVNTFSHKHEKTPTNDRGRQNHSLLIIILSRSFTFT